MSFINNQFKNISKPLYILPLVFGFISVLMMMSTSYSSGSIFSRTVIIQSSAYILGIISVFFIMKMNFSVLEDYKKHLYIFSVVFLLTPLIPGLGVESFGAKIWINIGITTFQPSEIVKLTFIFLLASYFKDRENKLNHLSEFLKAALYASPIILIVLRDDFGSAAVFGIIFIVMCLHAGLSRKLFAKLCFAFAVFLPFAFKFLAGYQKDRIVGFLYPNDLSIDANYQVWHSKVAIGSGGFFGKGLFNGTQKALEFLPVRNSDFIFAVICEEFGFLGGAIVICLLIWFLYTIYQETLRTKDMFDSLIIIGILGMFAAQVFENIAMTMGLMPVTGITLPFISYGGSSILSNMMAVGILLNIAQSNRGVAFIK